MRRSSYLIAILLSSISVVSAQSESSSFLFMLIGSGSRAAAMGEAYTAVDDDAGAPYFNPASAARMQQTEFSLMHINYLTDASMEHFSVITRSGKLRLGVGLYLGQSADFERRSDYPSDEPLGTFDEHNFDFSFYWAYPVGEKLTLGNSLKWAYQKLDTASASAFAADLGALYALFPEVSVGVSMRNLGSRPKFNVEAFDLPRELRIGAAYKALPESPLRGMLIASDFVVPHWGNKSNKFNIGSEYIYQSMFALRAGYSANYDSRGISIGGGIIYKSYIFDYAFIPSKNNLSDVHRLTLRIRL